MLASLMGTRRSVVHCRKRLVELSGVLGEGEPESGICASLREWPEHLRLLCFIAFLIQNEAATVKGRLRTHSRSAPGRG
ncbi:hypothetical protein D187_008502 [Cystobacter fuscus DSM 2262]|uniref:Uncharacterized protein n=1 Tax=Cystobacter fuscus (strain ATCC 25194 / DSM 2262 / NBRC 100088 / M29) TaxID=1242864 RepID=S9PD51_CYSF2|nr:hypothetical protein D187_008502 [Cystobacter fuscus DSM 2262]